MWEKEAILISCCLILNTRYQDRERASGAHRKSCQQQVNTKPMCTFQITMKWCNSSPGKGEHEIDSELWLASRVSRCYTREIALGVFCVYAYPPGTGWREGIPEIFCSWTLLKMVGISMKSRLTIFTKATPNQGLFPWHENSGKSPGLPVKMQMREV